VEIETYYGPRPLTVSSKMSTRKRKSTYGDGPNKRSKRSHKPSLQGNRPARRSVVSRPMRVGEKKGVDTALVLTPIIATTNTNGSCFVLNLIPPGTGSWNRVGRKVYLQSVRIKGSVVVSYSPAATTSNISAALIRMVLVWDKQPSGGAIPTFDTVFGTTDQAGLEATTVLSPPKYDNMDRFKVLKDCVIDAGINAVVTGGTQNFILNEEPIDEYVKLGGRECVYSGQSATQTIADISTGALYVYFRSTVNSSTTVPEVTSTTYARVRYSD